MDNNVAINDGIPFLENDMEVKKIGKKKRKSSMSNKAKEGSNNSNIVLDEIEEIRKEVNDTELLPWWEKDKAIVNEAEIIRFGVNPRGKSKEEVSTKHSAIKDAIRQTYELQEFVDKLLTEGVDYGLIKGFGKPSLFKPGAERLCQFFKVIPIVQIVNRVENYEKPFFCYEARMELIDLNDGTVRSVGVGISNSAEGSYSMFDPYSRQNVVIKMSKKRSLVDATLNMSGLSSKFSQDLEDFTTSGHGNRFQVDKAITKQQYDSLYTIIKEKHITEEKFKLILNEGFQIDSWRSLHYEQITSLISILQKIQ